MGIPKMWLKLSFPYSKYVLQRFLFITVLSNCVSGSLNFDTAFFPDCTKFCSVILSYWIGNLMRIFKMWLKLSFSHSKYILQTILFMNVLLNCVSGNLNFDTAFLPDCTKFCIGCYVIG